MGVPARVAGWDWERPVEPEEGHIPGSPEGSVRGVATASVLTLVWAFVASVDGGFWSRTLPSPQARQGRISEREAEGAAKGGELFWPCG